jgi:lysozyme family protein
MVPLSTEKLLADLIVTEGGYVDHAADRGGCTKFGITRETLADWRGMTAGQITCDDIARITMDEAKTIYRVRYVEGPGFTHIHDERLRTLLVDFGVHSGTRRAIKALQIAVGVGADGVIGPQTLAALERVGIDLAYRQVLRQRGELIADLLQSDPSQRVFAAGWLRRLMAFV